jgi:hypothetical protein
MSEEAGNQTYIQTFLLIEMAYKKINTFNNPHDKIVIRSEDVYNVTQGHIGLCMIYHLAQKFEHGNLAKSQITENILNDIIENLGGLTNYTFSNGLVGFGWAIEWLSQNDLIQENTNEYLDEMDDEVYKEVIVKRYENYTLEEGIIGTLLYLFRRLKTKSSGVNFYKQICLKEISSLLMDSLAERVKELVSNKSNSKKFTGLEIKFFGQSLMILTKFYFLRINHDLVKRTICNILDQSRSIINDYTEHNEPTIYLVHVCANYARIMGSHTWQIFTDEFFEDRIKTWSTSNMLTPETEFIFANYLGIEKKHFNSNLSIFEGFQYCEKKWGISTWSEAWLLS